MARYHKAGAAVADAVPLGPIVAKLRELAERMRDAQRVEIATFTGVLPLLRAAVTGLLSRESTVDNSQSGS